MSTARPAGLPSNIAALLGTCLVGWPATSAAEIRGIAAIGSAAADARSHAFTESLQKSPFGTATPTARVTLRASASPTDEVSLTAVADADSQRDGVLDLQEAWVSWNPVPGSAWRLRARAGAFFPASSLEIDYDGIGWNAARTLSSSAINSWINEEIRILGTEFSVNRLGAMTGSPHSYRATLGVFGGNDPAGTELAWRGWNVAGRSTGLVQTLRLPDLPVYRPGGAVPSQTRDVRVFREIDGRAGVHATLGYARDKWLEVAAMHYDNRGDPLRLENGQYSWHTRFDHLSVTLQFADGWELIGQGMRGRTEMGSDAVDVQFRAWYLLASREIGPGTATLRHDEFQTVDRDMTAADSNDEHGSAWALAYRMPMTQTLTLVTELLRVESDRSARSLLGDAPRQIESSLALELRWAF